MGETVQETLSEIEQARAALEADIDVLFERMPDPAVMARKAKVVGAAAAGTALVVTVTAMQLSKRAELEARRTEARINAEELARAFSPIEPAEADGGSRWPLLAALVAAIGAAITYLQAREA